jgi:hypothetical protein
MLTMANLDEIGSDCDVLKNFRNDCMTMIKNWGSRKIGELVVHLWVA